MRNISESMQIQQWAASSSKMEIILWLKATLMLQLKQHSKRTKDATTVGHKQLVKR